jgi:hypothetical protein
VQWRFAGPGQRVIDVRSVLDQVLAEPPVAMKARAIQIQIVAETD